jgi:hypothetical protein
VQRGKKSPHQRFTRKRVCAACVDEASDRVLGESERPDSLPCERCTAPTRRGKLVEYLTPRVVAAG